MLLMAFGSIKIENTVKYIFVSISGMLFSVLALSLMMRFQKCAAVKYFAMLGVYSYFCYLTHMKIFYVISENMKILSAIAFATYIAFTVITAFIFTSVWNLMMKKISKKA